MSDMLAVVQFIHPSKEQTRHRDGYCEWNMATRSDKAWPHRRKFLVCSASYLQHGRQRSGVVGFWGEWEGPTIVTHQEKASDGKPRCHHIPAYYEPESYEGRLDTDPFVFGERFLYCGCQQHTAHNRPTGAVETFLRRLDVGSLILFGSTIGNPRSFVLDTAFVVGDFVDYPIGKFGGLRGKVPGEYYALSLHPQTVGNSTCDSFRLYRSATVQEPVHGMFSFTPCRPYVGAKTGFPRPRVKLPGLVTQNLTQGKKRTVMGSLDDVRHTWDEVVRQIAAKHALAHYLALRPILVEKETAWTTSTK